MCIDHARRTKPSSVLVDAVASDPRAQEGLRGMPGPTPLRIALNREPGEQIRVACEELPSRQQEVFVLRSFHALTLREIAASVGRQIGTVKRQLFDATHTTCASLSAATGRRARRCRVYATPGRPMQVGAGQSSPPIQRDAGAYHT